MLWGRIAQRRSEARYPRLLNGLLMSACPHLHPRAGLSLYDVSGWCRNGTLSGMDPATDWVLSGQYNALDFDNIDDFVAMGSLSVYPSTITISLWYLIRTAPGATAFNTCLLSNQQAAIPYFGFDFRGSSTTTLEAGITVNSANPVVSLGTITLNTWTHVVASYNGAALVGYCNGAQTGSTAQTGVMNASTNSVNLARNPGFTSRRFNGQIADVAIWDRALSAGEVLLLNQIGPGGYLAPKRNRLLAYGTVSAPSGNRRRRVICGANC
jgi:hypothetical protein